MKEDEFIKALKDNKDDAYRQLMNDYSQRLYFYCLKILKNPHDAQDAVQITFIKVHSSISNFQGRARLSSWVYRIASNVCNDILRSRKRNNCISLSYENNENEFFEIVLTDLTADTENSIIENERKNELYKGISKLTSTQKNLILLRDIKGLSYNEISEKLNLKAGTVKSGLNRARKKLRLILEENKYYD